MNLDEQIIALYKKKLTPIEISVIVERTPSRVRQILRQNNIKKRKKKYHKLTLSEVAKRVGVSRQTLYYRHHKGIKNINELMQEFS